ESVGERDQHVIDERLGVGNLLDDELPELLQDRLLGLGPPKDHAGVGKQVAERIPPKFFLGVFPLVVERRLFLGRNATDDLRLQDVRVREVQATVIQDGENAVGRVEVGGGNHYE